MTQESDDIAAQTAAFLASGGSITEVEQVEDPKVAQAHFYNASGKVTASRYKRGAGRHPTKSKMALLMK